MPFRITYNATLLELMLDKRQKEKLLSMIEILVSFMANFIKVRPNPFMNIP